MSFTQAIWTLHEHYHRKPEYTGQKGTICCQLSAVPNKAEDTEGKCAAQLLTYWPTANREHWSNNMKVTPQSVNECHKIMACATAVLPRLLHKRNFRLLRTLVSLIREYQSGRIIVPYFMASPYGERLSFMVQKIKLRKTSYSFPF
jgi:hypothetical protein